MIELVRKGLEEERHTQSLSDLTVGTPISSKVFGPFPGRAVGAFGGLDVCDFAGGADLVDVLGGAEGLGAEEGLEGLGVDDSDSLGGGAESTRGGNPPGLGALAEFCGWPPTGVLAGRLSGGPLSLGPGESRGAENPISSLGVPGAVRGCMEPGLVGPADGGAPGPAW